MDWILRKHLSIFYKFPYFRSTWIDLAFPKTQHREIMEQFEIWTHMYREHWENQYMQESECEMLW